MTDPNKWWRQNSVLLRARKLDVDLMDEVWATDASASAFTPAPSSGGWENIRASWDGFSVTRLHADRRFEVSVESPGNVAWVTASKHDDGNNETMSRAQAYATNIFIFEDDRWLLVCTTHRSGHSEESV